MSAVLGREDYYLGIDPGQHGGMCLLDTNAKILSLVSMPQTEEGIWYWVSSEYYQLQPILSTIRCVIEGVHSMPGDGVHSAFLFGQNYGFIRACLVALRLPYEAVDPRTWQGAMKVVVEKITGEERSQRKKRIKHAVRSIVSQLYPKTKVTLGVCDAVLIARYAWQKHQR